MKLVNSLLPDLFQGLNRVLPSITEAKMPMGTCAPQAQRPGWRLVKVDSWGELRASWLNLSRAKDFPPRYPLLHRVFLGEKIVQGLGQVKGSGL
jgi:hypothetical protein